jgi:5-deoxy-glucuronate isomerase
MRIPARKLWRRQSASPRPPRALSMPQKLLYRPPRAPRAGVTLNLTPRALGWRRIHFAVRGLTAGQRWHGTSGRQECCLVLLRGAFDIIWNGAAHRIGPRRDVFVDYPHAVYLPAGTAFRVDAVDACEIADCRAPASRGFEARAIAPEECGYEIRGGGNATRQIVDIMPPDFPAERLMICEVFTPSGNWSSYPPHKHDTDNPPREADLEEIYYFRFREPDAYGFQRVYNRRRDDTLRVTHGDVVAVRDGYHPFVTAYGYDAYYLNVLAGDRRSMAASDDPRYAHLRRDWPPPDARMPMVRPPRALRTAHGATR